MTDWAVAKQHVADDITLLCDKHHKRATLKLLPEADIRAANEQPHNSSVHVSAGEIIPYSGDFCAVILGSVKCTISSKKIFSPIVIDGVRLIALKFFDSHPLISLLLFDESGKLVFRILDNEISYSVDLWDVEFIGNTLTIRDALREIRFQASFLPPSTVDIGIALFYFQGQFVEITREGIYFHNNEIVIADFTLEGSNLDCALLRIGAASIPALLGPVESALAFSRYPKPIRKIPPWQPQPNAS